MLHVRLSVWAHMRAHVRAQVHVHVCLTAGAAQWLPAARACLPQCGLRVCDLCIFACGHAWRWQCTRSIRTHRAGGGGEGPMGGLVGLGALRRWGRERRRGAAHHGLHRRGQIRLWSREHTAEGCAQCNVCSQQEGRQQCLRGEGRTGALRVPTQRAFASRVSPQRARQLPAGFMLRVREPAQL